MEASTSSERPLLSTILRASTVLNPQKFSEKETSIMNYNSLGEKAPAAPDFSSTKKTFPTCHGYFALINLPHFISSIHRVPFVLIFLFSSTFLGGCYWLSTARSIFSEPALKNRSPSARQRNPPEQCQAPRPTAPSTRRAISGPPPQRARAEPRKPLSRLGSWRPNTCPRCPTRGAPPRARSPIPRASTSPPLQNHFPLPISGEKKSAKTTSLLF